MITQPQIKQKTVQEFLTDDNWTQGCYARNQSGQPVNAESLTACKFCLLGAIQKCYPNRLLRQLAVAKVKEVCSRRIASFNDTARNFKQIKYLIMTADI